MHFLIIYSTLFSMTYGSIHLTNSLLNSQFGSFITSNRIDLFSADITSLDADSFRGLIEIEFLDLSHNHLNSIDSNTFIDLINLKELNLGKIAECYRNYLFYFYLI